MEVWPKYLSNTSFVFHFCQHHSNAGYCDLLGDMFICFYLRPSKLHYLHNKQSHPLLHYPVKMIFHWTQDTLPALALPCKAYVSQTM